MVRVLFEVIGGAVVIAAIIIGVKELTKSFMNRKPKAKQPKGFTLIELLVCIAIIGILSSVVLASLNAARQRGIDRNEGKSEQQIEKEDCVMQSKWTSISRMPAYCIKYLDLGGASINISQ